MRLTKAFVILIFLGSILLLFMGIMKENKDKDTTYPVITSEFEVLTCSVAELPDRLLEGLHAYDEKDGDLTDQIMISGHSTFVKPGVFSYHYVVFDSSNHAYRFSREVQLTDYTSPSFVLVSPLVFPLQKTGNILSCVEVFDVLDGNLSDMVEYSGDYINFFSPGVYYVNFSVTNSYNDSVTLRVPVHVVNQNLWQMKIELEEYSITVPVDTVLKPYDYVKALTTNQGIELDKTTLQVEISGDTSAPGVCEIHYYIQDSYGNTVENWLPVIVTKE